MWHISCKTATVGLLPAFELLLYRMEIMCGFLNSYASGCFCLEYTDSRFVFVVFPSSVYFTRQRMIVVLFSFVHIVYTVCI